MIVPFVGRPQLAVSQILLDIGVVIVFVVFGNPVPGLDREGEVVLFKDEIEIQQVPTAGEGFRTPVGLMPDAALN